MSDTKRLTSVNSPQNSLTKRDNSSVKRAYDDRMTISEAIEAVGRMIRGYANRGSADKGYIGAIAELLCQYPRTVARDCADPLRGVVTTTSYMPTSADIVKWCEPKSSVMRGRVEWEERAERQLQERREFEQKQHNRKETYDELKARYGENWGINNPDRKPKPTREQVLQALYDNYGREKVDAVPDAGPDAWRKLPRTYGDDDSKIPF